MNTTRDVDDLWPDSRQPRPVFDSGNPHESSSSRARSFGGYGVPVAAMAAAAFAIVALCAPVESPVGLPIAARSGAAAAAKSEALRALDRLFDLQSSAWRNWTSTDEETPTAASSIATDQDDATGIEPDPRAQHDPHSREGDNTGGGNPGDHDGSRAGALIEAPNDVGDSGDGGTGDEETAGHDDPTGDDDATGGDDAEGTENTTGHGDGNTTDTDSEEDGDTGDGGDDREADGGEDADPAPSPEQLVEDLIGGLGL